MKTVRQNLSKALLVGLFMFSLIMIALQGSSAAMVAVAAETGNVYAYDNTDVMDDLNGSDGFDIKDYPANANGVYEIFTFLEYGYSKNWTQYGLYLYVYNPQQKEISRSSASNKANVAVAYNDDGDASSYQRFEMKFCSASADGLFYKFRIIDPSNVILDTARKYAANNGGTRRYYIADVELFAYGETLATATKIGKRYDCTGYMKGFGDDKNVNTFDCVAHSYDVLDIELKHTFFRPEGNSTETSNSFGSKEQLDSVYFSFPNELIEHYGGIWKIATSYYAYQTMPIYVTSVKEIYDELLAYVGKDNYVGCSVEMYNYLLMPTFNQDLELSLWSTSSGFSKDYLATMLRAMNYFDIYGNYSEYNAPFAFLFYTGNEADNGSVPYAKDFTLSGERILEYIYNYNKSYSNGTLDIKDGISRDLFYKSDDDYYDKLTNVEICADETYTLENYVRKHHWYDILDWLDLFADYKCERYEDIPAIVPIDKEDLILEKSAFCKKYLIDETVYDDVIEKAKSDTETVYLFRFAQSSYLSTTMIAEDANDNVYGNEYNYAAIQTVYLDMNISSITCKKGDVYHTFAVCSNPIDAAADSEPPMQYDRAQWWKELGERIKMWFDDNKTALITAVIVIICVVLVVLIVIAVIKIAPSYMAIRSLKAPPKKRQSQKRKTPNKNAAQKTRAGRSKKK